MRIQSFQIIQFLLIYICSHSGLPGVALLPIGFTMCVTASCSWGSVAWRSMNRNMLQTKRRRRCSRISTVWRCARRNTRTVPRLYAKESVKTRLSFMKEKSSPVLKRVSLKRTRRWDSEIRYVFCFIFFKCKILG